MNHAQMYLAERHISTVMTEATPSAPQVLPRPRLRHRLRHAGSIGLRRTGIRMIAIGRRIDAPTWPVGLYR